MIEFLYGCVFGMCLVLVPAARVLWFARAEVKRREAEVMAFEADLAVERAIPKKRPRSTPIWPEREAKKESD